MQTHDFDRHNIYRLSDSENDFPEKAHSYSERVIGGPIAV